MMRPRLPKCLLALLIASAASGGETVIYLGVALQDVGAYPDSVAPSGSGNGKSNSISGNTVIVNGASADNAVGAVNWLDAAAVTGNQVIVNGTVTDQVMGGVAIGQNRDSAPVTGNRVAVNNGTVGYAYGGYAGVAVGSGSALANSNSVTINGGTVGVVYGGSASVYNNSVAAAAAATGNRVIISGGLISGRIYGGQTRIMDNGSGDAEATRNIVTISGHPSFGANSDIYGGLVVKYHHCPAVHSLVCNCRLWEYELTMNNRRIILKNRW